MQLCKKRTGQLALEKLDVAGLVFLEEIHGHVVVVSLGKVFVVLQPMQ